MKERVVIGLLLSAVVLVYGNTLANQFTLDDGLYVAGNPQVTDASASGLFAPHKFSGVFRPVTFATLALNWALGGDEPLGYHLLNLLLHAGVTWLLYLLLQAILGSSPQQRTIAFVAAMFFAVHPIHTEAVASIVGRAELLAAGFLLAGWILHLRDLEIPALLCFALALLSKESAVAFIPLVLVGDYARGAWKPRLRYAAMAGVALLYVGLFWKLRGGSLGLALSLEDNSLATIPTGWRILNALRVAWKYVGLQVYPAALSCDYSFNQIPVYMDWRHTLPAAVAAAVAVGAWVWAIWKRQAGLVLAGGIYLAGFAVTANILMPIGTVMGERLAYLPSAGLCLLFALVWIWLKDWQRPLAWGVLILLLLALGVRTVVRNRDWKDNLALFSAAVRAAPASAKMHTDLGNEYMNRNQVDLARTEFQAAVRIDPNFPDPLALYGLLEFHQGNYQIGGAMMEKALHMTGRGNLNYDYLAVNFAMMLMQTNHVEGALELLNQEVAESPGYAPAWSTRALIHYKSGEIAPARTDAETALRLNPGDTQALEVMNLLAGATPAGIPR